MPNKNKGTFLKSIYEWCIENNRQDILDRYDYELNDKSPKETSIYSHDKYYLKCPKNLHPSKLFSFNHANRDKNNTYICDTCSSIGQWCLDNDRIDILNRWDIKRNGKTAFEVNRYNHNSFYFLCDKNPEHESTKHSIQLFTKDTIIECISCDSFAKWAIENIDPDFMNLYWDKDKNRGINPWLFSKRSKKKIYIKCLKCDYHDSYEITFNDFFIGVRCPYCNCKSVHPYDSFGAFHINKDADFVLKYWSDKNTKSPFEYSVHSSFKVWFKCQKTNYHNDYLMSCNDFTRGERCPSCNTTHVHPLDSLGAKYPESINKWSERNELTPFDYYPQSKIKVYWKCESGSHDDYLREIFLEVKSYFMCPECSQLIQRSILVEKVCKYINDNYSYTLLHENKCTILPKNPKTKNNLPYDIELYEEKLIIECHGIQHYEPVAFHVMSAKKKGTTPEQELHYQQLKDRYKKYVAFCKGYFYLEIPYWTEKDESYKKLIDDKITEITNQKSIV